MQPTPSVMYSFPANNLGVCLNTVCSEYSAQVKSGETHSVSHSLCNRLDINKRGYDFMNHHKLYQKLY